MKKKIVGLVFLVSYQCFSAENKALAVERQGHGAYEELCEAKQGHNQDKVVDCQPDKKTDEQRECCAQLNNCVDSCCKSYFKATFIACSLFVVDKGIILGIL